MFSYTYIGFMMEAMKNIFKKVHLIGVGVYGK